MERIHTKLQKAVAEYRRQGLCSAEIAEKLGKCPKNINLVANTIGMPFSEEEKARSKRIGYEKLKTRAETSEERKQHHREYVSQKMPGWEWVKGWVFLDGERVWIRHIECGAVCEVASKTVRNGCQTACPSCEEKRRKQKEAEKIAKKQEALEAERQKRRSEKESRFWQQDFSQTELSFCPVCGGMAIGRKYCSTRCRNAWQNARKKDRRILKLSSGECDKITLKALYERKNGICYICGGECDYSDFEVRPDGTFIAGDNYPSIEHIVPLSKGGLHIWANVDLAHRICNALKGDQVVGL